MSDLTELLERVKAATGPDKVLDRDILCTIDGWTYEKRGRDRQPWMYGAKGERRDPPGVGFFGAARPTASIDAALALVERKLPEARLDLTQSFDGTWWDASLFNKDTSMNLLGETDRGMPTAPLAILAALVSALTSGASS